MKLGFVFQKDSHLKAVQATALRLSYQYANAKIQFYALDSDIEAGQVGAVNLTAAELQTIQDCDYLICCLGGYLLNKVIRQFAESSTKVIALFPGIVSHYQLDAFITRFNADQVWLNCMADYQLYSELCKSFNIRNNGILYGVSWFFDKKMHMNGCHELISSTVFFEQTQIITDNHTAQKIEIQLTKIIQAESNKPFIYKLRQNIHNDHLVKIRRNLSQFDNVQLLDELSDEQICQADTYLTISSSAIIEGLLLGKRCYLLDECFLDKDSREIFSGSGLFIKKGIGLVNLSWLKNRVQMPLDYVALSSIVKSSPKSFSRTNYLSVICSMFRFLLSYPKLLNIMTDRKRLKSIRKSLEYL